MLLMGLVVFQLFFSPPVFAEEPITPQALCEEGRAIIGNPSAECSNYTHAVEKADDSEEFAIESGVIDDEYYQNIPGAGQRLSLESRLGLSFRESSKKLEREHKEKCAKPSWVIDANTTILNDDFYECHEPPIIGSVEWEKQQAFMKKQEALSRQNEAREAARQKSQMISNVVLGLIGSLLVLLGLLEVWQSSWFKPWAKKFFAQVVEVLKKEATFKLAVVVPLIVIAIVAVLWLAKQSSYTGY